MPGSSGSGLFNKDNRVFSVLSGSYETHEVFYDIGSVSQLKKILAPNVDRIDGFEPNRADGFDFFVSGVLEKSNSNNVEISYYADNVESCIAYTDNIANIPIVINNKKWNKFKVHKDEVLHFSCKNNFGVEQIKNYVLKDVDTKPVKLKPNNFGFIVEPTKNSGGSMQFFSLFLLFFIGFLRKVKIYYKWLI